MRRARKFDRWLRPATQKVPVIAAVTLGSGVAGDKMRFLQMYTDDGAIITPSQFQTGVAYLDHLKGAGARTIERSEIEFNSDDELIQGLLTLAKNQSKEQSGTGTWWTYLGLDKIFRS